MKTLKIESEGLREQIEKVDRARGLSTSEGTSWMHFLILDKKGVLFASDKKRAHLLRVSGYKELNNLDWLKRPQVFAVFVGSDEDASLTVLDEGPEDVCKKLIDYNKLFYYDSEDFEAVTAKVKGKEIDRFCLGLSFDERAAAVQTLIPMPVNVQYLRDIADMEPYKIKVDMLEDPESPVLFEQAEFFACIKPFDGYER